MSVLLAKYNRWMNERIYEVCEQLTDAERKQDRGAFFKSIHGSLNHLLVGDSVWLARFQGRTYNVPSLDYELHTSFKDLRAARSILDEEIEEWAGELTDKDLQTTLQYTSVADAQQHNFEMSVAIAHFFNHQTHHRGQITTLLSQCGLACGATDLIALPGIER